MPEDAAVPAAAPSPFRPRTPVVIGILGGIAAGKSAVAAAFSAHGLTLVDADQIGKQQSQQVDVLDAIRAALGPVAVRDGQLDRQALAALVFADASSRAKLEAILHPRIRARILAELAAAKLRGDSVLLDVPLLLENGLIELCDHVVYVHTQMATRQARAASRGWTLEEHTRREAAQAPVDSKRARAQFVIDNDRDLATMQRDVAAVLARLSPSS